MKAVKFLLNDFDKASRDKREIGVMESLGWDVTVLYPYRDITGPCCGDYRFTNLKKIWLDRSQPPMLRKLYIILNEISAVKQVRKLDTDVISCHDIGALRIAWEANCFRQKKAKMIYDSHEFEIGRSGERSQLIKWCITRLEGFLMKRCAFSMMVNDTIADEVQRIHHLKERPIVVRNAAPLWDRDEKECGRIRSEFCSALNIPVSAFLVMYHGGVMRNRGIENMLLAIAQVPESAGVVLGNDEAAYLDELKEMADKLGIKDRVLFHPAVPVEILKNYVGAVDCGIITVPNTCMSYYYMLPNKYFENVQSETPIIGSKFPEITRLVEKYDIGLLSDPAKPEEIAACMIKMRDDREMYARFKKNLKTAKQDLCWENEKVKLVKAYNEKI